MRRAFPLLLLVTTLAACGTRGPLTLPPPTAKPPAAQPAQKPAPADDLSTPRNPA